MISNPQLVLVFAKQMLVSLKLFEDVALLYLEGIVIQEGDRANKLPARLLFLRIRCGA